MSREMPSLPLTKLRPPYSEARLLARPGLLSRLCEVRGRKLGLVVAPTGAGKSTLLAEAFAALTAEGLEQAWLSLDTGDNAPHRFLRALIAALRQADTRLGMEALAMLSGNAACEEALASLINDLTRRERPLVLFLDDYQELVDPAVHALTAYLLHYLPASVHLVIAAQREPPLPAPLSLSRIRARQWSVELGWQDLRFSAAEAREYLLALRALKLDQVQIDELVRQTEGWVCALQLATLALTERRTAEGALPDSAGRAAFADVLLEDVFTRQTPRVQRFLLATAQLERLSGALCDAVTGESGGGERLVALEKANLFLIRLTPGGEWLRYHHLFAAYLKARLSREAPEQARRAARRAGEWFAAQGHATEALGYFLTAGDTSRAAPLLASHGRQLLRDGDLKELAAWFDRLPEQTVAASAGLATLKAWTAVYLGQPLAVQEGIRQAQAARLAAPELAATTLPDEWQILRTMAGVIRYDWPDTVGLAARLGEAFSYREPLQRAFAQVVLGYGRRVAGDLPAAATHYRQAVDIAETGGAAAVNCLARYNLAVLDLLRARPDLALAGLAAWFDDPAQRPFLRTGSGAFLRVARANALIERGDPDAAVAELDEALSVLDVTGTHSFYGIAAVVRARCLWLLGREAEAWADLARARAAAAPRRIGRVLFRAGLAEARFNLRAGDLAAAERQLAASHEILAESGQEAGENLEAWQVVRCEWLVASGRSNDALVLAEEGERGARLAGRLRPVAEFLVWQSIAWLPRREGRQHARELLVRAQEICRPGGVVAPFAPPALAPLQAERAPPPAVIADAVTAPPLPPLQQREAQILQLLALGLRNQDIAQRLFLAEETVKWYLKRLYGSLGVANRVQLLARARQMGWLERGA